MPQYVIDAPGGGGKVPINPDYVGKITDDEVVFRHYEGHVFRYPLRSTPRKAASGAPLPVTGVEPIVMH